MNRLTPRLLLVALATVVLLPLAMTFLAWRTSTPQIWAHQLQYTLPQATFNSLVLVVSVAIGASLLGAILAWFVTTCRFAGRDFFEWALLLPLALPGYVLASAYVGLTDFTGPLQTALRATLGPTTRLPELRSLGGAALVLILTLYPYAFMLSKVAFTTMQRSVEAARTLGYSEPRIFWTLALPLARPATVAAAALVGMEVLADFGVMATLNVDTLTTTLYRTWFGFFAFDAALQLASVLVILALVGLTIERKARGARQYVEDRTPGGALVPRALPPAAGWAASLLASTILLLGFALPVIQLLVWANDYLREEWDPRYLEWTLRSLTLSTAGALLVTGAALARGFALRQEHSGAWKLCADLSLLGYAIPGTVLAVGLYYPLAQSALVGTVAVTLIAYLARFNAVGAGALDSGFARVPVRLDEASHLLGHGRWSTVKRIQLPLLHGSLISSVLLVFVELMKELPITLLTRPFGFDTLAVRVFELTAEGEWQRAAIPSLTLVAAGLIPVLLMTRHAFSRKEPLPK